MPTDDCDQDHIGDIFLMNDLIATNHILFASVAFALAILISAIWNFWITNISVTTKERLVSIQCSLQAISLLLLIVPWL